MKVIKKGRPQKGWSKEFDCTGSGNGGGGCGAILLVEEPDLFKTYSNARDETSTHITFRCVSCGVETDLDGSVPRNICSDLPSKQVWVSRHNAQRVHTDSDEGKD